MVLYINIIITFFCFYFVCSDIEKRKIPNTALFVLLLTQCLVIPFLFEFQLSSLFLVFIVGYILFYFKVIAAGDVKLASVLSLIVKPEFLVQSLEIMIFVGGIQAFYYLIKHYIFLTLQGQSNVKDMGIPYGVAICLGFYIGIRMSWL